MFFEYFVNDKIEFVFPDCTLKYTIRSIKRDIVNFNDINYESYYLHNLTHPNQHDEVFKKLRLDPFNHMKSLFGDYHVGFIKENESSQDEQVVPRFLRLEDVNKAIKDLRKLTNPKEEEGPQNLKVTCCYKLNDEIRITFPDNSILNYKVKKDGGVFYLHNLRNAYENEEIFDKMHVKPHAYLERILGYADWRQITPVYDNPLSIPYSTYCFHSLEDLNKVVADLKRELFSHNSMSFFRRVVEEERVQEEKAKFDIKIPKIKINLNFKV